jgi:hypothetical protein
MSVVPFQRAEHSIAAKTIREQQAVTCATCHRTQIFVLGRRPNLLDEWFFIVGPNLDSDEGAPTSAYLCSRGCLSAWLLAV